MIQQSAPLDHLDRIIFSCCGWGSGDPIGSNNDDDIVGGKALGGENNNQQTMEVRVMMATGRSRGDDDVNDVRPRPPGTQQPAIVGRGRESGDKDDEEED